MIIAVSVQIWKFTARNNGGAARQESTPKSATTHTRGTLVPEKIFFLEKNQSTSIKPYICL